MKRKKMKRKIPSLLVIFAVVLSIGIAYAVSPFDGVGPFSGEPESRFVLEDSDGNTWNLNMSDVDEYIKVYAEIDDDNLSEQLNDWLENNPNSLPIWTTTEERLRVDEIGNDFQSTASPPAPIRQPAEFEPMEGVLIRYPFGISYEIIAEMAEDIEVVTIVANSAQQSYVESQYLSHGVNLDNCKFLIAPTNSYWTRDYGPWFIFTGNDEQGIVDFIYNRPRPWDDQIPIVYGNDQGIPVYGMDLIHTGGNYMTDGQGIAVSTSLVQEENPDLTPEKINQTMAEYLGIYTYYVVPDALDEYIKHIDCWAKYLAPDVIMIIEVPQIHSQYDEIEATVAYFKNQISCYGTPYRVVRVYTPKGEPYINSLILNDKVFVPIEGSLWDNTALASYENAMPGYEVLGFTGSWYTTDALHCRVMGITDRYMLYIEHTPLPDGQLNDNGFDIEAKIDPYSGEALINDSLFVNWTIDGGEWNSVHMTHLTDDYYHAYIPPQPNHVERIQYYIHAEDYSSRSENHPYIGPLGAHTFKVNYRPEKPNKPMGPTYGVEGVDYTYLINTTDPDGDEVYYILDWGDGNLGDWLGPYKSGVTVTANHTWVEAGDYNMSVKAKDIYNGESNWSDNLSVNIANASRISIYTDKTTYTTGDTMHVGLDVTNPSDALPVRFAIWLEKVGDGIAVVTYTPVTLPAELDYSNQNYMVFTLPNLPAGTYLWHAALIEPTGPIIFISHDTAEWDFVPALVEGPTENIKGMREQTIFTIDFD